MKPNTIEETYAGESTIAVTLEIPKSLYVLARRCQIGLEFENLHDYILANIGCCAEGDAYYLDNREDEIKEYKERAYKQGLADELRAACDQRVAEGIPSEG